jgi:hypothetical protein
LDDDAWATIGGTSGDSGSLGADHLRLRRHDDAE